ncbi:MAG: tRNA lysidine(34) synthetase TilS [Paludibacteraceae bacterium]|nr:tRNA lysidine(34) synthetase TilS [Paludibacteraceae bacterium]
MEKIVASYINVHQLLTSSASVLVGVSGGPDSVCLALLLQQLGYRVTAAHCNFQLRGAESDRDEAFVRAFAERHAMPLTVTSFDTHGYAAARHLSIEMAARELRYGWFESERERLQAEAVAVAHHSDDVVETMLLNLIRGTGLQGLTGIRPVNGRVVRPLLEVSRRQILDYLSEKGETYVTDSTNAQCDFTRNKIRHRVLPVLEEVNPRIREVLLTNRSNFEAAARIYRKVMDEAVAAVAERRENTCCIDLAKVQAFQEPETLLFELLAPYRVHPAELAKILRMPTGSRFCNKEFDFAVERQGRGPRLLVVRPR